MVSPKYRVLPEAQRPIVDRPFIPHLFPIRLYFVLPNATFLNKQHKAEVTERRH